MWILVAITLYLGSGGVFAEKVREYEIESQCRLAQGALTIGKDSESHSAQTTYDCIYMRKN